MRNFLNEKAGLLALQYEQNTLYCLNPFHNTQNEYDVHCDIGLSVEGSINAAWILFHL